MLSVNWKTKIKNWIIIITVLVKVELKTIIRHWIFKMKTIRTISTVLEFKLNSPIIMILNLTRK